MPDLSKVITQLPEIFRVLIDQYGFSLYMEDEYVLVLQSPHCHIRIIFERYGIGAFVTLGSPQDKRDRYDYLLVMTMRCPDYRPRPEDDSLSDEQNILLDLQELNVNLIRYCPDLLAGDFSEIRRQGYHEFESYIKARTPTVMNLPAEDPIRKKFWQGDFTWANDLREREQHDGLTNP